MRIRADEHIAATILEAINSIAISDGFELTSVVGVGQRGATDVHWITAFATDGGHAILTADTDFLKQPPQIQAVERTGVRVIHLPSGWANATLALQASHLLAWWKRIEAQLQMMKMRECYTMPFNLSEEATLKRVPLDFHGNNRRAKKANRPSRTNAQIG